MCHVLFGFSSDELLCVPRVFCYLLSLSFFSGVKGMTIVFGPNLHVPWVLLLVSRVTCLSIYLCFLSVFGLGTGAVFSKANGEPMAVLVRSLVTLFISVFLSGFECVSLGRLCWLYCGRVLLLECVLSVIEHLVCILL